MQKERKKILLALDGSEQSAEMARYVAGFLPAETTDVVLFHVMSRVPEAFRDLALNPALYAEDKCIREWVEGQDRNIERFMEEGRKIFLDAGFPSHAIRVEVRELKEGFARDIAAEAVRGYSAVGLGRNGVNQLEDSVLGSIAAKITIRFCRIPRVVGRGAAHGRESPRGAGRFGHRHAGCGPCGEDGERENR